MLLSTLKPENTDHWDCKTNGYLKDFNGNPIEGAKLQLELYNIGDNPN